MWTESLQIMRCGLVPQGDHLRHCCHFPIAIEPSTEILSTPVTTFHVTHGTNPTNPEVWMRDLIMGGKRALSTVFYYVTISIVQNLP